MTGSGSWRAIIGATAIAGLVACGSDQSTNSPPPPALTAAQLALHFDSAAKTLSVSSPGDIRIQWYQEMVRMLARGASPSLLAIRVDGGPSDLHGLTEIDGFSTQVNAQLKADSTYILAMYGPPLAPVAFIDVHVWFVPDPGNPDTTIARVTVYPDTLGHTQIDTGAVVAVANLGARGNCPTTQLMYLTVPTNPCLKASVVWTIGAGIGLVAIDPGLAVSGVDFTSTP